MSNPSDEEKGGTGASVDAGQLTERTVVQPSESVDDKTEVLGDDDKTEILDDDKTAVSDSGIPKASSLAPGAAAREVINNRFELIKVLGEGGMGAVYKALDRRAQEASDRDPYVALKLLHEDFAAHPQAFISLQREARKSQRLAHPNIVTVYDFDRDYEGDRVFMTMEYLDGEPLDKLLARHRDECMPRERALSILRDISAALAHAHSNGIAHSDFKPGNVFVTERATKVLDFGIARAVSNPDAGPADDGEKTVFDPADLGALTPSYASLEMLRGEKPDTIDDIYALGVVAYELFSGRHPFDRMPADKASAADKKPRRIKGLSRREWTAIERALAFERDRRTSSVDAFIKAFDPPRRGLIAIAVVTLLVFAGALYYVQSQAPLVDEEALRADVALEIQQQQAREQAQELLKGADFSARWDGRMIAAWDGYTRIASPDDPWAGNFAVELVDGMLARLRAAREAGQFDTAQELATRIGQWQDRLEKQTGTRPGEASLAAEVAALEAAVAEFKAQQAAERAAQLAREKAEAEQRAAEEAAARQRAAERARASKIDDLFATVANHAACGRGFNASALSDGVAELRRLEPARFAAKEPEYVKSMVACIKRAAQSNPDTARKLKALAVTVFPGQSRLQNLVIDDCAPLAPGSGARGSRYTCSDTLANGGNGPTLVVVSAGGKRLAVGRYEVSNEEFGQFCRRSGACRPPAGRGDLPATGIDLATAQKYMAWLSTESGMDYRLPTYAEWLTAARAGSGREDPNRNCTVRAMGVQRGGATIKVSTGAPNDWGLVNVVGNVREMTLENGGVVLAGGAHDDLLDRCHLDTRAAYSGPDAMTGLRVIRNVQN